MKNAFLFLICSFTSIAIIGQSTLRPLKNQFGHLIRTDSFLSHVELRAVTGGTDVAPKFLPKSFKDPLFETVITSEDSCLFQTYYKPHRVATNTQSENDFQFGALFENHPYDYDWVFHYEWEEFDEALTTHKSEAYRILDLDTYGYDGYLHSAIWVNDGLNSGFLFNYDSENFISIVSDWDETISDHRLNELEIHQFDGELYYSASSVLDNTPYSWALNFNQTEFVEWQKEQNDAGYILVDLEIYLDPDDATFLFFAGLTKENPNQYNWTIAINQTLDAFIAKNEDFINRGYRIYDYEVISAEGFIRHSGIWVKDGVDNYSWVFNATDQEEFTSLIESNETKEKYPVLFNFLDLDQLQTPIVEKAWQYSIPVLYQNEPNPFFQNTSVRYNLKRGSQIHIAIFNRFGQKCFDLINTFQPAGEYSIIWENIDLNAGIYFCKLQTPEEASIIKMLKL